MPTIRTCLALAHLLPALLLGGCGVTPSAIYPTPQLATTSLDGSWVITGNRAQGQLPLLIVSLIVDGSLVTASGDIAVSCSVLGGSTIGNNFELTGQIAPDGSFQLTPVFPGPSTLMIQIAGQIPAPGATTWNGSYSITTTGPCNPSQASFTAIALAPVSGTYAGMLSSNTGNIQVSTFLIQQAPASIARLSGPYDYLPVGGTISVAGSPCFTHGTATSNAINQLEGDLSFVHFLMDDGSEVLLNSTFLNLDESSMQSILSVVGGRCTLSGYEGRLTQQ